MGIKKKRRDWPTKATNKPPWPWRVARLHSELRDAEQVRFGAARLDLIRTIPAFAFDRMEVRKCSAPHLRCHSDKGGEAPNALKWHEETETNTALLCRGELQGRFLKDLPCCHAPGCLESVPLDTVSRSRCGPHASNPNCCSAYYIPNRWTLRWNHISLQSWGALKVIFHPGALENGGKKNIFN